MSSERWDDILQDIVQYTLPWVYKKKNYLVYGQIVSKLLPCLTDNGSQWPKWSKKRVSPELNIRIVSKSQHDKTMIMKWHNFFRSCVVFKIVIITNVFKTTPEKKKIMLTTHKNIKWVRSFKSILKYKTQFALERFTMWRRIRKQDGCWSLANEITIISTYCCSLKRKTTFTRLYLDWANAILSMQFNYLVFE